MRVVRVVGVHLDRRWWILRRRVEEWGGGTGRILLHGHIRTDRSEGESHRHRGRRGGPDHGLLSATRHPIPPSPGRRGPAHRGRPRDRGQIARGAGPDHQRKDDPAQSDVDVHQFRVHRAAITAIVHVPIDLGGVPLGQASAHVGTEKIERGATSLRRPAPRQVHL